ncbi:hypothetical protein Sjap_019250 [Stephania japonica]|uniref:Secreted protein n=1 Tax=Stephania japonica TaxID=461633 RepID=A0AAP0EZP6_9MAGN
MVLIAATTYILPIQLLSFASTFPVCASLGQRAQIVQFFLTEPGSMLRTCWPVRSENRDSTMKEFTVEANNELWL